MELKPKRAAQSRSEQIQIVVPAHVNASNRLFGGQLVAWIDVVAVVVARRHSESEVVTASIDNLEFKAPACVGDTVVMVGQVTYTGKSSMEIRVDTHTEHMDGSRTLVNRAYLTMVAVGPDGRPRQVPPLAPETPEERAEWEAGAGRSRQRRLGRQPKA